MRLFPFGRKTEARKVLVIGLDCAAPELVFDRWRDELPAFRALMERGRWGELRSSLPAITVPAWSSMLSGRDPGELGIYGFRNRADHTYTGKFIATGNYVRVKRIWDYLDEAGKQSIVIGVPQTYPVRPINGQLISGFLAPGTDSEFTYPAALRDEVLAIAPGYSVDVREFRTENKDWLLDQIQDMTEKRFRVVDYLIRERPWDFFMLMEIGVDRIHHGFWSYHDPGHRRYQAGNPYERAIYDYYVRIDQKLGEWLDVIDDDTVVLVVSDHGAKKMDGGICVNEWLVREGYLSFKTPPEAGKITRFDEENVDWSKTMAWGDGGYYGRVFLNVKDREPEGVIEPAAYEQFRDELAEKLCAIPGPDGEDLGTRVFKPQEVYRSVSGVAPDLMVYFGDLDWRSVGSLGHGDVYTFENDTGPDDCNHAENGLFILADPQAEPRRSPVEGAQLMDVTPTLLELFGIPIPAEVQGESLRTRGGR